MKLVDRCESRMFSKYSRIAAFLAAASAAQALIAGCSAAEEAKLPPGRCMVSGECPQGETCRNTYCEDIYFPRREIKPY